MLTRLILGFIVIFVISIVVYIIAKRSKFLRRLTTDITEGISENSADDMEMQVDFIKQEIKRRQEDINVRIEKEKKEKQELKKIFKSN